MGTPLTKTFVVETEVTITRRYRVVVCEGENPWDMWKEKKRRVLIDMERISERVMSIEKG